MTRRLLIVTEAGDVWPSGRNRALIYRDLFRADGVETRYLTRLAPGLVKPALSQRRAVGRLMDLGLRRVLGRISQTIAQVKAPQIIRAAKQSDVVYLEKISSPELVLALRRQTRARLVYDLNDAVWLPWMKRFFPGDITEILRNVDAVTCDNRYGLAFARTHNPSGFLVPEPALVELFDRHRSARIAQKETVTLGWIGAPTTLFNLYSIWEPLEALFRQFDHISLRIVGAGHDWRLLPRFEKVRLTTVPAYGEAEMLREVLGMDIGLYPLFDVEDSRVRGIHKPAVYMSGEACVLAAALGENLELIADGTNGFLAASGAEWYDKLSRLVQDRDLRRRTAHAGLETARAQFSLRRCYESLVQALFP